MYSLGAFDTGARTATILENVRRLAAAELERQIQAGQALEPLTALPAGPGGILTPEPQAPANGTALAPVVPLPQPPQLQAGIPTAGLLIGGLALAGMFLARGRRRV